MCRMLRVPFSGFYAWLKKPLSHRARDDAGQTGLIRQAWSDSGKVYGYRKLTDDLRDQGETCSENRVARLASPAGILAQVGYKRRPGRYGGKPAVVASNTLDLQFEVDAPDTVWVTDITYIKTHEGWLYLSVVIDLFSRRVVGWSAQPRMTTDLALPALLAAVWRRKPKAKVMIHSDQGSQFTSREWQVSSKLGARQ
jgi:putative transposase